MRRGRRIPANTPEGRLQQRLRGIEAKPTNWAGLRSDDNGPMRIIRGTVDTGGAGSIVSGAGFTINRTGAGAMTITFSTVFSSVPAVTAMTKYVAAAYVVDFVAINANNWSFQITNLAGVGVDNAVSFIAIGPA